MQCATILCIERGAQPHNSQNSRQQEHFCVLNSKFSISTTIKHSRWWWFKARLYTSSKYIDTHFFFSIDEYLIGCFTNVNTEPAVSSSRAYTELWPTGVAIERTYIISFRSHRICLSEPLYSYNQPDWSWFMMKDLSAEFIILKQWFNSRDKCLFILRGTQKEDSHSGLVCRGMFSQSKYTKKRMLWELVKRWYSMNKKVFDLNGNLQNSLTITIA